jgi:hypothetical protein
VLCCRFHDQEIGDRATLYAFYDLKVEPITFDVLWFLTGAELERRRLGMKHVYVVIAPGSVEGVREEDAQYEAAVDREARRWRIQNIIIGSIPLLPSCSGFTLAASRHEVAMIRNRVSSRIYPRTYEPALPVTHYPNDSLIPARAGTRPVAALRAESQALRYIDRWLSSRSGGRRVVTVTLRNYEYGQARNSNLAAWGAFARKLDPAVWFPVIVLDTERTLDELPSEVSGLEVFREVAWNLGLRMALYERAWLNMGVNNGPMGLCWLNERTRYITFKLVTSSVMQASVAFIRSKGFEPNESLPFATPFQKWVWEDDTLQVIEREFLTMVARIESA